VQIKLAQEKKLDGVGGMKITKNSDKCKEMRKRGVFGGKSLGRGGLERD